MDKDKLTSSPSCTTEWGTDFKSRVRRLYFTIALWVKLQVVCAIQHRMRQTESAWHTSSRPPPHFRHRVNRHHHQRVCAPSHSIKWVLCKAAWAVRAGRKLLPCSSAPSLSRLLPTMPFCFQYLVVSTMEICPSTRLPQNMLKTQAPPPCIW